MKLRPHHLLCLISYSGRGYSEEFIRAMNEAQKAYLGGETVELVDGMDLVCLDCPHCGRGGACTKTAGAQPDDLDRRAREMLGLTESGTTTIYEVIHALSSRAPDELRGACRNCSWLNEADCSRRIGERIRWFERQVDPSDPEK